MSGPDPITAAHAPPAADRDASARDLIERQMAMLTRLAEIGMEIAEAAGRKARALAEGGETGAVDPGLSYARAARAVRLTIALQSRLAKDLAGLGRAETLARVAEAARRRDRIHRRVEQAIGTERYDEDEVERLSSDAWERLTDEDDGDLLERPIDEVVARICQDLGLSPTECEGGVEGSLGHPAGDSSPASRWSRTPYSPRPALAGEVAAVRRTEGASLTPPRAASSPPRPHSCSPPPG
ncbi:MAG TPA: hypothetical protein VL460_10165 [Caulobacteraceae bacterium]|jgi:hypothetical protein|nr:hypothetical protein [Caulobacteraceae bacterium]